jgi:hypothetical protein
MSIPYAREYTAKLAGSVLKLVLCENCGVEYVYRLERTATGSGTSMLFLDNRGARERASHLAEDRLRALLEQEIEAVPCPDCGWFQRSMIPKARSDHAHWMLTAGLVFLIVGFIAFALSFINGPPQNPTPPWLHTAFVVAYGVCGVAGVGLLVGKFLRASRFDPNDMDPEARIKIGQGRARRREDLERPRMSYTPVILSSETRREFAIGDCRAALLANIQAVGGVEYTYILVVRDRSGEPRLFVTSEVNALSGEFNALSELMAEVTGGGSHFLGVFPGEGHENLGMSDDWADIDRFTERAVAIAKDRLGVRGTEIP